MSGEGSPSGSAPGPDPIDGGAAGGGRAVPAVWSVPRSPAYPASLTAFCTVAAPLLAGFSLSALLALRDEDGAAAAVALGLFGVGAVVLVAAIQAALVGAMHHAAPPEWLAWYPESSDDLVLLSWLRAEQWREAEFATRWRARARLAYNAGISAFLLGVVAVLVPRPGGWTAPRLVALVVACAAAAVELWGLARSFDRRAVARPAVPATEPPFADPRWLRAVLHGGGQQAGG